MDGEAPATENQPQPDPALMDGAAAAPGDAPAGGLVLGEDGLPVQQEENKEDEIIPPEILEDMKNVWSVFNTENHGAVEIHHLRTILRALDFDLDPDELAIVRKQIDPEETGVIKYANLKLVMEDKLKDKDTAEDMISELKHLDRDKDDRIPVPEFKQFMANMGTKMTNEEIEDLMKEVDVRNDGYIYIDEMAARLCPPKK